MADSLHDLVQKPNVHQMKMSPDNLCPGLRVIYLF